MALSKHKKTLFSRIREAFTLLLCIFIMFVCLVGSYNYPLTIIVISLALAPFNLISIIDGARRFVFFIIICQLIILIYALQQPDLIKIMNAPSQFSHWLLFVSITLLSVVRFTETWTWILHIYVQHYGWLGNTWLLRPFLRGHQYHHRIDGNISNYYSNKVEKESVGNSLYEISEKVIDKTKVKKITTKRLSKKAVREKANKRNDRSIEKTIQYYKDKFSYSFFRPAFPINAIHIFLHLALVNLPISIVYLFVFYTGYAFYTIVCVDYAHRAQHCYKSHWWEKYPIIDALFSDYFRWTQILHICHHESEDKFNFAVLDPSIDIIGGTMACQKKGKRIQEIITNSTIGGETYIKLTRAFSVPSSPEDLQSQNLQIAQAIKEIAEEQKEEKKKHKKERDKLVEISNSRQVSNFFELIPSVDNQLFIWSSDRFCNKTISYARGFLNVIEAILAEENKLKLNTQEIHRYRSFQTKANTLLNAAMSLKK